MILAALEQQAWATALSAIIVAMIGGVVAVWTRQSTREEAHNAQTAAEISTTAVRTIEDYKRALEAKDAVIESITEQGNRNEERCNQLEEELRKTKEDLKEAREQMEELIEALRSASLLEKEWFRSTKSDGGGESTQPS